MVRDDRLGARYVGGRWIAAACVAVAAVILLESRSTPASIQRRVRRTATVVVAALVMPELIVVVTRALDSRTFDIAAVTRLAALSGSAPRHRDTGVPVTVGVYAQPAARDHPPRARFAFAALMLAVFWLPLLLVAAQASQSAPATILLVTNCQRWRYCFCSALSFLPEPDLAPPAVRQPAEPSVRRPGQGAGRPPATAPMTQPMTEPMTQWCAVTCDCQRCRSRQRTGQDCRNSSSALRSTFARASRLRVRDAPPWSSRPTMSAVRNRLDGRSGCLQAPGLRHARRCFRSGRCAQRAEPSRRASRAALALINLRLGLWLHNPLQPSAENSGGRIRSWALASLARARTSGDVAGGPGRPVHQASVRLRLRRRSLGQLRDRRTLRRRSGPSSRSTPRWIRAGSATC